MSAVRRTPGRFTLSLDTLSFFGGWYLMIYQAQFSGTFNATAFFGGMLATGVPGVQQFILLWLGARTPLEPLPSPEQASSVE